MYEILNTLRQNSLEIWCQPTNLESLLEQNKYLRSMYFYKKLTYLMERKWQPTHISFRTSWTEEPGRSMGAGKESDT